MALPEPTATSFHEEITKITHPFGPTILVIFGSMGDLTWHKLAPALYNLLISRQLPEHFAVIGLDFKNQGLDECENSVPTDFPNYESGTCGPKATETFILKDGRNWL